MDPSVIILPNSFFLTLNIKEVTNVLNLTWTRILIDMDGTLCGESEWRSFFWNTRRLFDKLIYTPPNNINWSILTSRPRIDRIWVWKVCKKYDLSPKKIITAPSWLYSFEDKKAVADWKWSVIDEALNSKLIERVIYIDNDPEILQAMMPHNKLKLYDTKTVQEYFNKLKEI